MRWERGEEVERMFITGRPKSERSGMKPEAPSANRAERFVERARAPVVEVADDRRTEAREMRPDLMQTAGL